MSLSARDVEADDEFRARADVVERGAPDALEGGALVDDRALRVHEAERDAVLHVHEADDHVLDGVVADARADRDDGPW